MFLSSLSIRIWFASMIGRRPTDRWDGPDERRFSRGQPSRDVDRRRRNMEMVIPEILSKGNSNDII